MACCHAAFCCVACRPMICHHGVSYHPMAYHRAVCRCGIFHRAACRPMAYHRVVCRCGSICRFDLPDVRAGVAAGRHPPHHLTWATIYHHSICAGRCGLQIWPCGRPRLVCGAVPLHHACRDCHACRVGAGCGYACGGLAWLGSQKLDCLPGQTILPGRPPQK